MNYNNNGLMRKAGYSSLELLIIHDQYVNSLQNSGLTRVQARERWKTYFQSAKDEEAWGEAVSISTRWLAP